MKIVIFNVKYNTQKGDLYKYRKIFKDIFPVRESCRTATLISQIRHATAGRTAI